MKILIASLLFLSTTVLGADNLSNADVLTVNEHGSEFCRVTCTIQVQTDWGIVGVSATAGNIFMSCEKAGKKACAKAGEKAVDMLINGIQ